MVQIRCYNGENTHRMPVETTADIGQWAIEISLKRRKAKEHHKRKKQEKEKDKRRGNKFPPQYKHVASEKNTHRMSMETTADTDQWAKT